MHKFSCYNIESLGKNCLPPITYGVREIAAAIAIQMDTIPKPWIIIPPKNIY